MKFHQLELLSSILLFVPLFSYSQILQECGNPGTRNNPAADTIHLSRMCRPFHNGTKRAPLGHPCLTMKAYVAGLYLDQVGISVSCIDKNEMMVRHGPLECENKIKNENYRIISIAAQAINENGYPFGTFVEQFPVGSPTQFIRNQFYIDASFADDRNGANVHPNIEILGTRNKNCQKYTNRTLGKQCTCMEMSKRELTRNFGGGLPETSYPARYFFNNDTFRPDFEYVKCQFPSPDSLHNPDFFPEPHMIVAKLNQSLDFYVKVGERNNMGFDFVFYFHTKEFAVGTDPNMTVPDTKFIINVEVHFTENNVEMISNYCTNVFQFSSSKINSGKYKGENTKLYGRKCGDESFGSLLPLPNHDLFQYRDAKQTPLICEIAETYLKEVKNIPPENFQLSKREITTTSTTTVTSSPTTTTTVTPSPTTTTTVTPSPTTTTTVTPSPTTTTTVTPSLTVATSVTPSSATTSTTSTATTTPISATITTVAGNPGVSLPNVSRVPKVSATFRTDEDEDDLHEGTVRTVGTTIGLIEAEQTVLTKQDVFRVCKITKACLAGTRLRVLGEDIEETETKLGQACVEKSSCRIMLMFGQERFGFKVGLFETLLELYGENRNWIAVAFSHDLRMREDFVVECVWEGTGQSGENDVNLYTSRNSWDNTLQFQRVNKRNPKHITDGIVRLIYTNRTSTFIWCMFAIKTNVDLLPQKVMRVSTLDQSEFYLLFAEGFEQTRSLGHNGSLQPGHTYEDAYLYRNKTNLNQKFNPNLYQKSLLYAHAYVMMLAWMLFFPVASFIARYYKETWVKVKVKLIGWPLWLFLHVLFSIIGIFLVCIGFGLLTVAKSDWEYVGGMRSTQHLWTGIAAASLYATNIYGGIFLEDRDTKSDFHTSEFMHGIFGHATIICSFLSLHSANKIYLSYAPCSISSIIIVWFIFYFLFHAIMSFHYIWVDWVLGNTARVYCSFGTFRSVFPTYDPNRVEDAPGAHIRNNILILFIIVQTAFTVLTASVYASAKTPCYKLKEYESFIYH